MKGLKVSEPLYLQVYRLIRESIFKGEIVAGEKIIVSKLAEELQISRTPLREALRQLESEGLLIQKNSALYVVDLDLRDFYELYETRIVLEKENMKLIAEVINDDMLEKVEEILQQTDEALVEKDFFRLMDLNSTFHDTILEASPNRRMVMLLQQVKALLFIYRVNILNNSEYNHEINKEHHMIYQALKARDKEKLLKIMEMHLSNDLERGSKVLESQ